MRWSQCRNSKRGLKQGPWRRAGYWLTLHGLFRLLSYTTSEPCAQVAPLIVGCTHPHRWPIEKMSHRLAYRPMWRERFLEWGILFLMALMCSTKTQSTQSPRLLLKRCLQAIKIALDFQWSCSLYSQQYFMDAITSSGNDYLEVAVRLVQ